MNVTAQPNRIFTALLAASLLLPWGCTEQKISADVIGSAETKVIAPQSYSELQKLFAAMDYDLHSLHTGVPRLMLTRLPNDMDRLTIVPERKRLFFLSLLPMVLMANEEVANQRSRLNLLLYKSDQGSLLSEEERQWLIELTRRYGLSGNPLNEKHLLNRLLERVDIIPPSLVLAQAANESGWGTSRFARVANNLFGEWTFTPGTGIVPQDRPPGATYEVRKFDDIYQSLRSYIHNLNTHRAYRPLRMIRANKRAQGLEPQGPDLAAGLDKYSIRRDAYVEEIRAMIDQNDLTALSQKNLKFAPNIP